jgi:hypothetical protein
VGSAFDGALNKNDVGLVPLTTKRVAVCMRDYRNKGVIRSIEGQLQSLSDKEKPRERYTAGPEFWLLGRKQKQSHSIESRIRGNGTIATSRR